MGRTSRSGGHSVPDRVTRVLTNLNFDAGRGIALSDGALPVVMTDRMHNAYGFAGGRVEPVVRVMQWVASTRALSRTSRSVLRDVARRAPD